MIISEHLDATDAGADLDAALRWQRERAWTALERWERGEVPINEPAARLLRGGQMSETMAELYEREFPTPVGKKLAALTRKSEEVARRIDELNEKIQSEPLDSKRFRGLVRKFLSAANEHMRAVNQIEHELDRLGAAALR